MYLKQRQENKKNFIADNLETIREKSAINSINKPKD